MTCPPGCWTHLLGGAPPPPERIGQAYTLPLPVPCVHCWRVMGTHEVAMVVKIERTSRAVNSEFECPACFEGRGVICTHLNDARSCEECRHDGATVAELREAYPMVRP